MNKPMVFGKNNDKGIILNGLTPKVVDLAEGKYSINDLWVHDENDESPARAFILSQFSELENFPLPIGIFRKINKSTYDDDFHKQIEEVKKKKGEGDLRKLYFTGNMWEVN